MRCLWVQVLGFVRGLCGVLGYCRCGTYVVVLLGFVDDPLPASEIGVHKRLALRGPDK